MKRIINGRVVCTSSGCALCGMHPCGSDHVCDPEMIKWHTEYLKKNETMSYQEIEEMLGEPSDD